MKTTSLLGSFLLLAMMSLVSPSVYAQDKSSEFLIESSSLKELKKYKWKEVTKYFKDFDKKEIVSVRVKYTNTAEKQDTKGQIADFNIAVSGEARHAKDLTQKMESILELLTGKF
mgnify:CR=1 FL=1|jgi:hypothetical protein